MMMMDDDFKFNDALIQCVYVREGERGGGGGGALRSFASKWYINLVWYWNS